MMQLFARAREIVGLGRAMYLPGCITLNSHPGIEKDYLIILEKIGAIKSRESLGACCGEWTCGHGEAKGGEDDDSGLNEMIRKTGTTKVITSCGLCYQKMRKQGLFAVEHVTQTIARNIERLQLTAQSGTVCYHDPCMLGRRSGIYEEPRQILARMGYTLAEFADNRASSQCCGACGLLMSQDKALALRIGEDLLSKCPAPVLVVASASCFGHLNELSSKVKVVELSSLIIKAMGQGEPG